MYSNYGEVVATHGKVHDYLGMTLDFRKEGCMIVDMSEYTGKMVEELKEKYELCGMAKTFAKESLFHPSEGELLSAEMAANFHMYIAKGLFSRQRSRPNAKTVVLAMMMRVKEPRESDWEILLQYMKFLDSTWSKVLTLSADSLHVIKWYVDASFAVHPDFWSHLGGVMTMGGEAIQSLLKKQKLNMKSSCESELVRADDASGAVLWT